MPSASISALAGDLRIAVGRASRRIRAERGAAGLTDPQFTVLAWLTKEGPLTPGQLAERERIQPPSMTRTVNGLVELGLVAKTEHPSDGRQVVVSLTDAGVAEVRETRRRRDAWLAGRLATLTPDERALLVDAAELLRRIAAS
ncbi:MarR family winged helix-turn-helix transcriptional regulator [Cellulomonas fengjieae]|uniref:MarR family transcriptional regulator n=1 Tax=Cellulomonas fengjieae TaxID=2819978 RepID=A0ABS3SLL5_9CELL|nr:MarR family transcriptional regulator [Cellulomonas fengjieae]MBO3086653.1 MarR family transcriptional regulator [Cellulomonas fengjieae]MBO3100645.1 MarR family transcriptional regulator [Cellulomonas fengjieae]QVI66499.1 MarR family transcriptional regulator [Cellulomonas fengjieae]